MAFAQATTERPSGAIDHGLSGSRSGSAYASGREKRRSAAGAAASSTTRNPVVACCSSHSRA